MSRRAEARSGLEPAQISALLVARNDSIANGGPLQDTAERRCLCNGLAATIGLAQHRADGYAGPALLTFGKDLDFVSHLWQPGSTQYQASDVIDHLLES